MPERPEQNTEQTDRNEAHLSALAEAAFARRMLRAGCTLQKETPTPSGRHADFHIRHPQASFYVHIKRLWVNLPTEQPALPAPLCALHDIPRGVDLALTWDGGASPQAIEEMAVQVREFARQASVGDEFLARDHEGVQLGRCRIVGAHPGTHARVQAGDLSAMDEAVPRAQRLLRRAFSQFMPGAPNVICVVGDNPASHAALEVALLGTMTERWDRFPPRGHRVAHGRAPDGFWAHGRYESCHLACWMPLQDDQPGHLWRREGSTGETDVEEVMRLALRGYSPTA